MNQSNNKKRFCRDDLKRFEIRFKNETFDQLKKIAEKDGVSITKIIRQLTHEYLASNVTKH